MSSDGGGLSRREHDELRDLVLAGTQSIRPAGSLRGQFVAAGVALLLVGGVAGGALTWTLREQNPPATVMGTPAPGTTVWSGWVAFSAGQGDGDIYLVKNGSPAHRILGSDTDDADQVCPAFSPDGARLASGEVPSNTDVGGGNAALVITDLTAEGAPSNTTSLPLDGVTDPPCPIWSADGRWLAFGVEGRGQGGVDQVWVVEAATNQIRRLTGVPATDLEWSPSASELFIASNGLTVYSTATDRTRVVPGTAGAVALTTSPDGTSLAVQHDPNVHADGPVDLISMDADGSHQRTLVAGYRVDYGIGPVWSPDGNRVLFQRRCDTYTDTSGKRWPCLEEHDVVVVTARDHDPGGPFGTQTVIPPPQTTVGGQSRQWFPDSVSWAPDSMTLLYLGWATPHGNGILAVPVDGTPPVILDHALGVAGRSGAPWNTFQSWRNQP